MTQVNRPQPRTLAIARRFFNKFGYTEELFIDDFDCFIIDESMADDPETDDTSDARFMKFIQQRGHAKTILNKGGSWMEDAPFAIDILIPGKLYAVRRWSESTVDAAREIGDKVRTYSRNKQAVLEADLSLVNKLIRERGMTEELAETRKVLVYMLDQSKGLHNTISASVNQYQLAWDAVHEKTDHLKSRYAALPSPEEG
jgi:hypothetical protein